MRDLQGIFRQWPSTRDLGVLREHAPIGPQTPCFDCAWASWPYWITDSGMIVGVSENNETDPLTGAPILLAVAWKDGRIINLGTLGGNESAASAANFRGDVVGAALTSTIEPFPNRWPYLGFLFFGSETQSHAVLWRNGMVRDLKTLGGPSSIALFVNDNGLVAGASDVDYASHPTSKTQTAVLRFTHSCGRTARCTTSLRTRLPACSEEPMGRFRGSIIAVR